MKVKLAGKILEFKLTVLSPTHLGCREYFDLTNSFFDKENENSYLVEYDLFDYLIRHPNISSDIDYIFKFENFFLIQKNYWNILQKNKPKDLTKIKIPNDLYKKWEEYINQKQSQIINLFEIQRTIFEVHTKRPYIPGSSIKGAIRTALLNEIIAGKYKSTLDHIIERNKLKEEIILEYSNQVTGKKDISQDPFKFFKVSDFHLESKENFTKVFFVRHTNRDKYVPKPLTQLLECILPEKVFYGKIFFQYGKNTFTLSNIYHSIKNYYQKRLEEEKKIYSHLGLSYQIEKYFKQLEDKHNGKKLFLIRLGRYTGAESKTIEIIREQKKTINRQKSPKTIWFATEYENNRLPQPLGWCMLRLEKEYDLGRENE